MNQVRLMIIALSALAAALFIIIPVAVARRLSGNRAAKRVKYHTAKALEAIKDYTSDQRDEAIGQAKATMNDLDDRIETLQQTLFSNWDQMDQTAREKTRSSLYELTKKRNQVAEWYGAMVHSSAEAWNDVKEGFMDSFNTLSASFHQAQSEFT